MKMANSLLKAFEYVNIEDWTLEKIQRTIEGVEKNIEAIKDSSIPLQNQKEIQKTLKDLKDYKIALLDLKQKKIHERISRKNYILSPGKVHVNNCNNCNYKDECTVERENIGKNENALRHYFCFDHSNLEEDI